MVRGACEWSGACAVARAVELDAVTENLHDIATAGELSASRLPQLFLTLERNVQWWPSDPMLAYGQRVSFPGSQLVWEYYPGQGLQLQILASFGKANGLFDQGPSEYPAMQSLLGELIPLAAQRAGGIALGVRLRLRRRLIRRG